MSVADVYRATAAELSAKACSETDERMQREWGALARAYMRLAEQAERNAKFDVVYEHPRFARRDGD